MRCIFVIFLPLFLLFTDSLKAHPAYSLIRFYTDDVRSVASLGVDIVKVKRGLAVEAVVPEHKIELLYGMDYEVIIWDMEEYYSRKMRGKVGFGDFYTYDEAYAIIDSLSIVYPTLIKKRWEIGEGWQGGKIYALKLSDNPNVDENEPEVLLDACIHAREPVTVNVLVETIRSILQNYGEDPEYTFLVDNRELYFIPILNPDGYLYNESEHPGGGGMWRKNMRANGDSGVDLNRNFPYMWGYDDLGSSPYVWDETYRGPFPASEPETQAYINFTQGHNFVTSLSYHSYAGLLLTPWGYDGTLPPDYDIIYEPFAIYLTCDNNYPYGPPGYYLYNVNGATLDWQYGEEGCYSFSPEVNGNSFWDEASIERNLAECVPMNIKLALASGPYLTPKEYTIDDTEYGDGDGNIDPSETVNMSVTIKNVGIFDDVYRVGGLLSTRDAYIELHDAFAAFGYLAEGGEVVCSDPYMVSCNPDCPEGHIVNFTLSLLGSNYSSQAEFEDIVGEPTYIFLDDFEQGGGNWIWDYPWSVTSNQSHSPDNSATDSPDGNYGNLWDRSLTTSCGLDISCASYAELSFCHRYLLEDSYDYGYCEVSIDDGASWQTLKGYTGYELDWINERISLNNYCGNCNLRIRFRLNTDTYVTDDGWFIDDVSVWAYPVGNHEPSSPVPIYPVDTDTVYSVYLVVENADDIDGDSLTYGFKVYSDSMLTGLIIDTAGIREGVDTTICELQLPSGTYFWWAYAEDPLVRGLCCLPVSFTVVEMGVSESLENNLPSIYPNPAKGIVKIEYSNQGSPTQILVSVRIYDIAGRHIKTLTRRGNILYWDGIDDDGKEVPNGIYYLEACEGIRHKIVFFR